MYNICQIYMYNNNICMICIYIYILCRIFIYIYIHISYMHINLQKILKLKLLRVVFVNYSSNYWVVDKGFS